MVMHNELALHSKQEIEIYFGYVWRTMRACIDRGLNTEGVLSGPLRVPRRASAILRMLVSYDKLSSYPMNVIEWVNMFALAVNEENASGGRVVTAPTNGACGIVLAVLAYYDHFIESVIPDIYPLLYGSRRDRRTVQDECLHFPVLKSALPAIWRRPIWPSYWVVARNRSVCQRRLAWNTTLG